VAQWQVGAPASAGGAARLADGIVAVLKADLHTHTAGDPTDSISHSPFDLVDHAVSLGYGALAITLHDRQLPIEDVAAYGRRRGLVIIPGIERSVNGKHVLLLNFSAEAEEVKTFNDVRRLKAAGRGIVVAPHPFYPLFSCLGRDLERNADVFDAVEVNGFYTSSLDFNRRAVAWARAHSKPLVGNGDVHRLSQLGTTFSLIDAEPNADAICAAVRSGRVEVCTTPLPALRAAALFASLVFPDFA
jgi:predicted metal-dependent phosphoesterase TrpH